MPVHLASSYLPACPARAADSSRTARVPQNREVAEIAPLRALRYADQSEPLGDLLCPPYDVISDAERDRLYGLSPYNFVRVEHPKPDGDPYARAAADLAAWCQRGAMKRDSSPALYVHDH